MNQMYGFEGEVKSKYPLWRTLLSIHKGGQNIFDTVSPPPHTHPHKPLSSPPPHLQLYLYPLSLLYLLGLIQVAQIQGSALYVCRIVDQAAGRLVKNNLKKRKEIELISKWMVCEKKNLL